MIEFENKRLDDKKAHECGFESALMYYKPCDADEPFCGMPKTAYYRTEEPNIETQDLNILQLYTIDFKRERVNVSPRQTINFTVEFENDPGRIIMGEILANDLPKGELFCSLSQ